MGLTRGRWKWDKEKGCFVDYVEEKPKHVAPAVITDEIQAQVSAADGRVYTSRSKMIRAAKAAGFRPTEGERDVASKREERSEQEYRDSVEKAYHLVKNGMAPLTEKERAHCEAMNKRIADADRGNN